MSVEEKHLQELVGGIGRAIGESLEKELGRSVVGYALLLFDFGDSGTMAYASNARRDDMVKALAELLVKLRGS